LKQVVIVGGVAAGMSTAARLRRLDEHARIVVLERDRYVSYANCGLPYHIGGAIPDRESLLLVTPEHVRSTLNLDVRTEHEVIAVDRAARLVHVPDRTSRVRYSEPYDVLVLAQGANPTRPPIPGINHPRVFTLRSIPDMDAIITALRDNARTAVVIGGSYIGVEVTEALREGGLDVHMVEMQDQVMPLLDREIRSICTLQDMPVTTPAAPRRVAPGGGTRTVAALLHGWLSQLPGLSHPPPARLQ
jgi:NADPH-dependent 2,4-dienoyl-CoA reductase/sulfur reductase-like enzyme